MPPYEDMRYILIAPDGEEMRFHIKALAEMYQTIHGGVVVDSWTEAPWATYGDTVVPLFSPKQKVG